jgi:S-adenosylmethionine uptake transporter
LSETAPPLESSDKTPTVSRVAGPGLGVAFYLTGVFLFAVNDAIGKWLVADYGVGQLMMLRSIGAAFVLAPLALTLRPALLRVENPPLQFLRVVMMAGDTFCFYWATRTMPLADVMTFYMAAPLMVTALSAPLLGETVERFRWIAVLIGFVGVAIALRPTPQMFSWGSPIALFGAMLFALGQIFTRKLRRSHWLQLTVWQFAVGGAIGAATIPFAWNTPTGFDLSLMALVGVVSMFCFILITRALAIARAAVLAPLHYSAILWAALMGWLVWRDVPTLPIIVGNAVIIGGGLYLLWASRGAEAEDTIARSDIP